MKNHTKIYLNHFGYQACDFVPCEICGCQAVDIHHIDSRKMGGSKTKDYIENLMALCRIHHEHYGDKKQFRDMLIEVHGKHLKKVA